MSRRVLSLRSAALMRFRAILTFFWIRPRPKRDLCISGGTCWLPDFLIEK